MSSHSITIRPACLADAQGMMAVINPIIELGGSTAHRTAFDVQRMQNHYIAPKLGIACTVAVEGGEIIGYQSLAHPDPTWEGANKMPGDWAIIASFVALGQHGKGVGKLLLAMTLNAARAVNITNIDATIRQENVGGQAYYEKIGFVTYHETVQTVSKKYDVSG